MRAFVGPLTRDLANAALAMAQAALLAWRGNNPQGLKCRVDLSNLGRVDTSALAVVLGLQRYARSLGFELVWIAMPAALLELAKLSSVDRLIARA